MTSDEPGRDTASPVGVVTVAETGAGTYTSRSPPDATNSSPTNPFRWATIPARIPMTWYWPAWARVRP